MDLRFPTLNELDLTIRLNTNVQIFAKSNNMQTNGSNSVLFFVASLRCHNNATFSRTASCRASIDVIVLYDLL